MGDGVSLSLISGVLWAVFGYLCGSIPFGLLLSKAAGLGDIRSIGSGNIGATNVLRTGSKKIAATTLLLDCAKGFVPVAIALNTEGAHAAMLAGLAALAGHMFPAWLNFNGGKGVATYIGVLAALSWQLALLFLATWLTVAALLRYSSLSALTAVVAVPVAAFVWHGGELAVYLAGLAFAIFAKHYENIGRLLKGEESKITFGKSRGS